MHLVIVSCTPRPIRNSNTAKIIEKFKQGFERQGGNTTETYYLAQRSSWEEIRQAFYHNDHILFAIPLFVECIPGIMLEFLDTLQPKTYDSGKERTKVSFLLQGGFAEASQLRCGEQYLEMLPQYFNCEYAGTLIKGNMFAVSMVEGKGREAMIEPFVQMGETFAQDGAFHKEKVTEFAKPEYFSKGFIIFFRFVSPLQKMFLSSFSKKKLGRKESIKAKPYQKYIQ